MKLSKFFDACTPPGSYYVCRATLFHPIVAGLYTRAEVLLKNTEHAAEGFGGAPKELVADGKSAEELRSEIQLVQAPDGNIEGAGNRRGREAAHRRFLIVGDDAHPRIGRGEDLFDLIERQVLLELDAQRLAVAAHGADAHADAVHRHGRMKAENFVGLGDTFPFFPGLASGHVLVNPGNQAAGERHTDFSGWQCGAPLSFNHHAVHFESV